MNICNHAEQKWCTIVRDVVLMQVCGTAMIIPTVRVTILNNGVRIHVHENFALQRRERKHLWSPGRQLYRACVVRCNMSSVNNLT